MEKSIDFCDKHCYILQQVKLKPILSIRLINSLVRHQHHRQCNQRYQSPYNSCITIAYTINVLNYFLSIWNSLLYYSYFVTIFFRFASKTSLMFKFNCFFVLKCMLEFVWWGKISNYKTETIPFSSVHSLFMMLSQCLF